MRILRVVNISIKTLAINLVAVSALSTSAIAQSFDYPANSPTLFNRGTTQPPAPSPRPPAPSPQPSSPMGFSGGQLPSMHEIHRDISSGPSGFSKLFSRKSKPEQPVFESAFQNTAAANIPSYSTGESVSIDNYAQQLLNRHQNQVNRAGGYEPTNQKNQLQRAAFNQFEGNKPHSILERFDTPRGAPTTPPAVNSVVPPAPANFNPATSTRLEKKPQAIVAEPAAKVAKRVSIPDNAFEQEFEKAYRYINQSDPKNKNGATRIAKADGSFAELSIEGLSTEQRRQELLSDFEPNNSLDIDTPDFISPSQSEQSPNASAPDFAPLQSSEDFETFPTDSVPEVTPDFTPSGSAGSSERSLNTESDFTPNNPMEIGTLPFTPPAQSKDFDTLPTDSAPDVTPEVTVYTLSAPAKTSERSLIEALKANEIEGDFEDSLGDVDQWQPPKPSNNQDWQPPKPSADKKSLEEDLAELSKPFIRPNASGSKSRAPESVVSSSSFHPYDQSPIWWKQQVIQPLHPENQAFPINSNGLVFAALQNSPRIQAVSKNPLIRELQVVEADAEFDPVRFVRSQWQDRVDPVGNSLTIGDDSTIQFLKENIWTGEAGIRRRTRTGADVTVSQQLGFQNSNSLNFVPQDQGTATLALNVTQPLLRGRGRAFNQAQILIAQSTGGVAWEVFQQELQEELEGVVAAYWQLYLERSIYLQRKRNVERGQIILDRLNGRRELDSLPSQIARARSSVQTRKTELANAFRNVRNAETEIRRRVADRNWMASQRLELLPEELPSVQNLGWGLDQVVKTALNNRPEIRESIRRIKIAGVQRDVSENELLPELSLLVGTYVSALQGDSDVFGAFGDQFGDVTPGYSFGLEYELPRFNRAARSRFQQRHLQLKRLQNELEEVIQNVIAESQIALRRTTSAIETLVAAEQAIVAARADLTQNETRWESFALVEGDIAEGVNPTTVLDQLLDSQERLSQSEIVYAQAEQELKVAEVALQRAMGTLLMHQQVSYNRNVVGDTPKVHIHKNGGGPAPIETEVIMPNAMHPGEIISHGESIYIE